MLLIGGLPPPIGGTAVSFKMLADELRSRSGVRIGVISTSYRGSPRIAAKAACFVRVTLSLLRGIRDADIVTLHASFPGTRMFGPVALTLCRLFRKPFLLREFGGSFDEEYRSGTRLDRALLAYMFTGSGVLLQTRGLVEFFGRRFPAANCLWYSNSRPMTAGGKGGARGPHLRFASIGHVKPTKGIREILAAAAALPDFRFEVDVYGPLLDGMRKEDLEGAPNVSYRGVLKPESVAGVLAGYDVLLLPSYHEGEGYPGILLEGFMLGVPCIATRWRAIPEIVEDGVNGLLIEPRSADALSGAMRKLLESPGLLEALSRGAAEAAGRFDSARWTERFLEICADAVRGSGRGEGG